MAGKVTILVEAGVPGDGYRVIVTNEKTGEKEYCWFGMHETRWMFQFINGREIEWLPGESYWSGADVTEGFFKAMVKRYQDVEAHENWRRKEGYANA